jgi:hypothetical protein
MHCPSSQIWDAHSSSATHGCPIAHGVQPPVLELSSASEVEDVDAAAPDDVVGPGAPVVVPADCTQLPVSSPEYSPYANPDPHSGAGMLQNPSGSQRAPVI